MVIFEKNSMDNFVSASASKIGAAARGTGEGETTIPMVVAGVYAFNNLKNYNGNDVDDVFDVYLCGKAKNCGNPTEPPTPDPKP